MSIQSAHTDLQEIRCTLARVDFIHDDADVRVVNQNPLVLLPAFTSSIGCEWGTCTGEYAACWDHTSGEHPNNRLEVICRPRRERRVECTSHNAININIKQAGVTWFTPGLPMIAVFPPLKEGKQQLQQRQQQQQGRTNHLTDMLSSTACEARHPRHMLIDGTKRNGKTAGLDVNSPMV